jgi:hypothetical protein
VTIASRSSGTTIKYKPITDFFEESNVTVRVRCHDLAHPANLLDSTYTFAVGISQVKTTNQDTIDQFGGTVGEGSSGITITIPGGALDDTTEIAIGIVQRPPVLSDTLHGLGLTYYFRPDGLHFVDSVIVRIPYSKADLDSAGVTDPMDLAIYSFSTMQGGWTKRYVSDTTSCSVFIKVKEFGYLALGKVKKTVSMVEDKTLDITLPTSFGLSQNYPNPFNPSTLIRFDIKDLCRVVLKVYDIRGREIATLTDAMYTPGGYAVRFNAMGLAPGIYIYQIRMGAFKAVRKMGVIE